MTKKIMVTVDDIVAAGMCRRNGARPWFKEHGLDWSDFVMKGGIDADIILAIDDAMAHQVVEVARGRTK